MRGNSVIFNVSGPVSRMALALALGLSATSLAEARSRRAHPVAAAETTMPQWGAQPTGPVIIVVSIADQRLTLYDNGVAVAKTVVSTGIPGHLTPRGIFTIIQKDRNHHSNIYSNAPMPYMQRITWSGVALHEGHVTGRQASHGCIRMPQAFAARLWPYTKMGMRVIVSNTDLKPEDFAHPNLFAAVARPSTASVAPTSRQRFAQADNGSASDASLASAALEPRTAPKTTDAREAAAETPALTVETAEASAAIAALADAPASTPVVAAAPAPAAEPVVATSPVEPAAEVAALPSSETAPTVEQRVLPTPQPIVIPPGSGHITMFISKKAGKLFVRRNFTPLFETPVVIRDPAKPLGAHVFTAMEVKDAGANVRWTSVDVPDASPPAPQRRLRKGEVAAEPVAEPAPSTAAEALDRIIVPDEARIALAALIQPGASLVVSDQGLGRETTAKGTDFIVLTR